MGLSNPTMQIIDIPLCVSLSASIYVSLVGRVCVLCVHLKALKSRRTQLQVESSAGLKQLQSATGSFFGFVAFTSFSLVSTCLLISAEVSGAHIVAKDGEESDEKRGTIMKRETENSNEKNNKIHKDFQLV